MQIRTGCQPQFDWHPIRGATPPVASHFGGNAAIAEARARYAASRLNSSSVFINVVRITGSSSVTSAKSSR